MPTGSRRPKYGVGYFDVAFHGAAIEESSGGVHHVRLNAFARQNTAERPYAVVNDYIASKLGAAAGVPVPPGNLLGLHGGGYGYVAMAFGERGDTAPPVIPPTFCVERPWEACGIIAFDQWVANTDRHNRNLAYVADVGVAAFDHDLALINHYHPSADAKAALAGSLDLECKGHCLPPHVVDMSHFPEWFERIASVTRREIMQIVDTCHSARLVDASLRDALIDFIEHRQTRIRSYVDRTYAEYAKVKNWTLDTEEVDRDS
ncbi:hypothetical protein ACIF80_00510 [Streptomyces sp. NPDC085927]|uniref:hypothetical protein n=1 Tax=Streptomyces sp. NPDC085927 TaxID=3365738 RepID=UPI0037CD6BD6